MSGYDHTCNLNCWFAQSAAANPAKIMGTCQDYGGMLLRLWDVTCFLLSNDVLLNMGLR